MNIENDRKNATASSANLANELAVELVAEVAVAT